MREDTIILGKLTEEVDAVINSYRSCVIGLTLIISLMLTHFYIVSTSALNLAEYVEIALSKKKSSL